MAGSQLLFIIFCIQAVAFAIRYQTCDPPQRPDNGGYYDNPHKTRFSIGSKIRFFCKDGYKLEGALWTVCSSYNKRAQWLHQSPVCKPNSCPGLIDPRFGSIQVTGYTPGSTALYKCNRGYKLVGYTLRKCYNGYWSGREPVCQVFQPCGGLGTPLSTSAGLVTCSATRQCPPRYFCHSANNFAVCCPVTPPISTTTQEPPVTMATTTDTLPSSGSGSGSGEWDDNELDSEEEQQQYNIVQFIEYN